MKKVRLLFTAETVCNAFGWGFAAGMVLTATVLGAVLIPMIPH